MKKTLLITLAAIILLFVAAQDSLACKCKSNEGPQDILVEQAFNASAAVFSVEVLEITAVDENTLLVKIKLVDSWKSASGSEIVVRTNAQSSICGYKFVVGTKYLVYATGESDKLHTSHCSRTNIYNTNLADLIYLEKYKLSHPTAAGERLLDFGETQDLAEEATDWHSDLLDDNDLEAAIQNAWMAREDLGGKTRREILQIMYVDAESLIQDKEVLAKFKKGWDSYQPKP